MEKIEIKRGYVFQWMSDEARVMAISDGYAMCRKKGCNGIIAPKWLPEGMKWSKTMMGGKR